MQNYRIKLLRRLVGESPLHKNEIARIAGIKANSLSRLLAGTNKLSSVESIVGLSQDFCT